MIGEYDYATANGADINYDTDNQYDVKFETKGNQNFTQHGMREPQLRNSFRGNIVTLAQKQQW